MGVWVYGLYTHVVISSPQVSIQRQQSTTEEAPGAKFKKQLSKNQLSKLQEEWDKEIPQVSLLRVAKLNAPEWWIILIGMVSYRIFFFGGGRGGGEGGGRGGKYTLRPKVLGFLAHPLAQTLQYLTISSCLFLARYFGSRREWLHLACLCSPFRRDTGGVCPPTR